MTSAPGARSDSMQQRMEPEPASDLEADIESAPTSDLDAETESARASDLDAGTEPAPASDLDAGTEPAPALDADTQRLRQDYAKNLDNRLQATVLGVLALAAALYPALLAWLVASIGLRTVALLLTVAGIVSGIASRNAAARPAGVVATLLAATTAVTGAMLPLLVLPALIYAALAYAFLASAGEETSAVERAARAIQPAAPDFIGPYCRRVTALWGVVFAVNAIVLLVAALAATPQTWRAIAGTWIWSAMAVVAAAEFLVRKTYFRNYWYGGPFEQLWSRLFPSEATPMGRRSAEHIRQTRHKLGL